MLKKTTKIENVVHFGFDWTMGYENGKKVQHYLSIDHLLGLYQLVKKNRVNLQFKMFAKGKSTQSGYELLKKQIVQLADIRNALLEHGRYAPIIASK